MQDTDRNKTCCFIGHRKIKESEELKNKMLETIEHLIKEKEVCIFLFGSKSKFDDFAHKIVTELQEKYPHCEVELNDGGQPIYYYVISVE